MGSDQANGVGGPSLPLEELSKTIFDNAGTVSQYLDAHALPQPYLQSNGPSTVLPTSSPREVLEAREMLIAASPEMLQLAIGPSEYLPHLATGVSFPRPNPLPRHPR